MECLFPDVARGVSEDDLMFSEEEDSEVCATGEAAHSHLKIPAVQGPLSLNRFVFWNVMQGFICPCILLDNVFIQKYCSGFNTIQYGIRPPRGEEGNLSDACSRLQKHSCNVQCNYF